MWHIFKKNEWWRQWQSWLAIGGVLTLTLLIGIKFDVFSDDGRGQLRYDANPYGYYQTARMGFSDVSANLPEAQAIDFLYRNGIVQGYGDGTFQPNRKVSRAEMAKLLIQTDPRSNWSRPQPRYENCFRDVGAEWFAPFVCQAVNNGWVRGYTDKTFRPEQEVSKAEAVKMVVLATGIPYEPNVLGLPYTDVEPQSWYFQFVLSAYHYGLLDRFDYDRLFEPNITLNRAQVAELIYRAILVNPDKYNLTFKPSRQFYETARPTFGIKLNSYPNCLAGANDGSCTVTARVGETINFSYEILTEARNIGDLTHRFDYNRSVLDCVESLRQNLSYYRDQYRGDYSCEVVGRGRTDVTATVRPVYDNGVREDFRSRAVTVIAE